LQSAKDHAAQLAKLKTEHDEAAAKYVRNLKEKEEELERMTTQIVFKVRFHNQPSDSPRSWRLELSTMNRKAPAEAFHPPKRTILPRNGLLLKRVYQVIRIHPFSNVVFP